MCSFFKTLTTEKGQLYLLTNENDYAPVFNDYFLDHQDFCFDCLEIMFKLKFQGTSITNSLLQDILMYLDL